MKNFAAALHRNRFRCCLLFCLAGLFLSSCAGRRAEPVQIILPTSLQLTDATDEAPPPITINIKPEAGRQSRPKAATREPSSISEKKAAAEAPPAIPSAKTVRPQLSPASTKRPSAIKMETRAPAPESPRPVEFRMKAPYPVVGAIVGKALESAPPESGSPPEEMAPAPAMEEEPLSAENSAVAASHPENYKVELAADALLRIPGPPGELRVWIGFPGYAAHFREDMHRTAGSLPAVGETARVTPFSNGLKIEPQAGICMKIHPSGSEVRFQLVPVSAGIFRVGAEVHLFDSPDCSGAPIPRAVESLDVRVEVDVKEIGENRLRELWAVFWDTFLDFWGAVLALFFGLLIFLLRERLKKWFGYEEKK